MTPEDNQPEFPSSSKKKKPAQAGQAKNPHQQIKREETRLVGGSPGIPGPRGWSSATPAHQARKISLQAGKKAALLPKAGEGVKVTEKGGGTEINKIETD